MFVGQFVLFGESCCFCGPGGIGSVLLVGREPSAGVGAGLSLEEIAGRGCCCLCSGLASLQDLLVRSGAGGGSLGVLLWVAADVLVCLSSGLLQSTGLGP